MSAGAAVAPPSSDELAVGWREKACAEPVSALAEAEDLLAARGSADQRRVLARHVAALACVELGRAEQARRHAELGLADALRRGEPEPAAQLRLTLAWIELERGATAACRVRLAEAEPQLDAAGRARACCLRGLLHVQTGRHRKARERFTAALDRLGAGDRRWRANALLGRGLANLYDNRLADAEEDLAAAEEIFAAEGRSLRAGGCRHNRGCVAHRAGDLPRALRLFEQAQAIGLDESVLPEAMVDRGEALAAAGLTEQARVIMERAAERLEACGRSGRLAETRLALAGCALRAGDPVAAATEASAARRSFRGQRRPAWAALACAVAWQAKLRAGRYSRFTLAAARRVAAECERFGWAVPAAELRITAARCAQRAGLGGTARALLGGCATPRTGAPPQERALGHLAEALLAEQDGDAARLFRACRDGLRQVDEQAAGMAAFELRVHALGVADELGEVAVRAALRVGDPRLVLRWTERSRAAALQRRALRPPSDRRLGVELVELRAAVQDVSRGARPERGRDEVARRERRVRQRAMLAQGGTRKLPDPGGLAEISAELGDSALLSFFAHDGSVLAASIMDGVTRLHALGAVREVEQQVGRLRHLLARQATGVAARAAPMFQHGTEVTAADLQARLLGPVLPELERGRPLVVVPTGALHLLPWSALPTCRGRSVTVAPSIRCWRGGAERVRRGAPAGPGAWIAGPGLEHAEREVRALHERHGGRLLRGSEATCEQVLSTLDGAGTVHLAAHGHFRSDQPLMSCVDLADGPMFAHDLDRLHRSPTTVVLSACDVGKSAVSRGDQLRGLTTTLLDRGAATVIASVVPVPDERTAEVMCALHDALAAGRPPAAALARAQAAHGESGFICVGYGGGR
ncbi:CHAT domain-containing protein [Saccharopolyspora griseoalba]|uniref:CHAT domain-containing protein n=1 Tax=Saccharopolyspora griseoalba TaxID=1431848 RepID=A0ABW2LGE6_9PSEU